MITNTILNLIQHIDGDEIILLCESLKGIIWLVFTSV